MCGRYVFTPNERYYDRFEIENRLERILNSYNVAPSHDMPVITRNSPNKTVLMRWGLSPAWMKGKAGPINARAESIDEKPMFAKPFKMNRCLVPANGFYEWKKDEKNKIPFYITLKHNDMFAFAGIYDEHKDAGGKIHRSFAIITTSPNNLMKKIHNRMPVIFTHEEESQWLDPNSDSNMLKQLLDPYPDADMKAYPVSRDVNSPRNNSKDLLKEVSY